MRIVPGEEDVNFERVTKVYREESGKKTLVSLEADFYDKLAAYVVRLDEAANKEAQKDPNSPKALLLQDELRKVRKRRDQIFTYRERKLALLASSRASGADVEIPNLPAQERTLFENMVAVLKKARAESFGGSPFGSEPAAAAKPEGPCPRARARGPPTLRRDRHDLSTEEGGCRHAPEDDCTDPRRPRESPDRPDVRGDPVRSLTAFTLGTPRGVVRPRSDQVRFRRPGHGTLDVRGARDLDRRIPLRGALPAAKTARRGTRVRRCAGGSDRRRRAPSVHSVTRQGLNTPIA